MEKPLRGPRLHHQGEGLPWRRAPTRYIPFGRRVRQVLRRRSRRLLHRLSALFGELMCARAQADPALVAITAAMCDGTGLCGFRSLPDRFYDVGIAEEHTLTFAAGLAAAGAHPVLGIYSSFCQRCFDQILHDAALPALPVLAVDRAGLVCADGPTHHGVFDVSFLRGVPG